MFDHGRQRSFEVKIRQERCDVLAGMIHRQRQPIYNSCMTLAYVGDMFMRLNIFKYRASCIFATAELFVTLALTLYDTIITIRDEPFNIESADISVRSQKYGQVQER